MFIESSTVFVMILFLLVVNIMILRLWDNRLFQLVYLLLLWYCRFAFIKLVKQITNLLIWLNRLLDVRLLNNNIFLCVLIYGIIGSIWNLIDISFHSFRIIFFLIFLTSISLHLLQSFLCCANFNILTGSNLLDVTF